MAEDRKKRVLVIGSGASGLTAIKCCVDEGLEPVCVERTGHVGGMWRYQDSVQDGVSTVMKSTVINTSKEMMCYSDFPIPAEYANFMHNTQLYKYLKMYRDHFGLNNYIKFNTEVTTVKQAKSFSTTGQWEVHTVDKHSGKSRRDVFDAVLVCTGHHADKKMPNFPGEQDFQGQIMHSHDYRNPKGFEDKRVVVVGIGNSGGDVAVELSKVCSQVYLSTRRGAWVINRVSKRGMPVDMEKTRRIVELIQQLIPRSMKNALLENEMNDHFDHYDYGIAPEHRLDSQHPTVNDELPNRLTCGSIIIKPNIRQLTKTGVEFEDGTVEDNIDTVIYATGYVFGFPFIKHPDLEVEDNWVPLYKYCFPPNMSPSTLAVIGYIQPLGAINPISELQCRWATRVFKGCAKLPSRDSMWENIEKKKTLMAQRYVHSTRHTLQVDWIDFMDQVAEEIKCKPDIARLWFTDPRLAFEVYFGPCTPYQYRLHGPGAWSGARNAIMTQWQRAAAPHKTRAVPPRPNNHVWVLVLGVLLLAWLLKKLLDTLTF